VAANPENAEARSAQLFPHNSGTCTVTADNLAATVLKHRSCTVVSTVSSSIYIM